MKPLVSILIPAYNAQEWVADTVASALGQTWPRKEIIVVDDGSTDATLEIARRFAAPTVRVVTQPNQGAAAARNAAYRLSQGDYIQWLDADDLLAPDKIERQMTVLEHGCDQRTLLSAAWGSFMYRAHRAEFHPTPLWCDLSALEWLLRKIAQNLYMPPATWLVSRLLAEAAGPWDVRLTLDDDGEYFCRLVLASAGIRFVPEARVYYRRSGFSSMSSVGRADKKLESQFLSLKLHVSYIRSLADSDTVRSACVEFLQRWLPSFHPERDDIVLQLQQLASELGGRLELSPLPWKYAWVQQQFGWKAARQAQLLLPRLKWSWLRAWDKTLVRFDPPATFGPLVQRR